MDNNECPCCKEEIKAGAIICKHCHTKLDITRAERVISAMQLTPSPVVSTPSFSPCEGVCYATFQAPEDKGKLEECLDECRALEAIAALADRLNQELNKTIIEIIWEGGDIDPLPFEKKVRERFSQPR